MRQDYPAMIYHVETEQHKVVNDEKEKEFWFSQGWTSNYKVYDTVTKAQKKIEWHKKEIDRLEKELQNCDQTVKIDQPVPVVVNSTVAPIEDNKVAIPTPTKRRGRTKKEGK